MIILRMHQDFLSISLFRQSIELRNFIFCLSCWTALVLLPSLVNNASAQDKPFVVVLDAGHCPHDEVPDQVNSALLEWINQL